MNECTWQISDETVQIAKGVKDLKRHFYQRTDLPGVVTLFLLCVFSINGGQFLSHLMVLSKTVF